MEGLTDILGGNMFVVLNANSARKSAKQVLSTISTPIDVEGKPEVQFKCLKRLVRERGFEHPAPGPEPDSGVY
jgi:hypothetical protein